MKWNNIIINIVLSSRQGRRNAFWFHEIQDELGQTKRMNPFRHTWVFILTAIPCFTTWAPLDSWALGMSGALSENFYVAALAVAALAEALVPRVASRTEEVLMGPLVP